MGLRRSVTVRAMVRSRVRATGRDGVWVRASRWAKGTVVGVLSGMWE